jgi:hypothetical protein
VPLHKFNAELDAALNAALRYATRDLRKLLKNPITPLPKETYGHFAALSAAPALSSWLCQSFPVKADLKSVGVLKLAAATGLADCPVCCVALVSPASLP